jgi:hypothetical protein
MGTDLTARPRTVFLSSGGFLGDAVLRRLIESGQFDITGVVRSRRVMVRGAGFLRGAVAYFARCGIIYTVYIWTITTFAEFVGLFTGTGSITRRANQRGIPILHTQDVNNAQGREFLAHCEPDLLISAHFDQKLEPTLCDGPGWGAVNIHPSLLPNHRGLEPVLNTMLGQESDFGVTVHRIARDIDTGAILAAEEIKADPRESVLRVMLNLVKSGATLLAASAREAQRPGAGTTQTGKDCYHSWPTGRDIGQLYRSGKHLMRPRDFALFWRDN